MDIGTLSSPRRAGMADSGPRNGAAVNPALSSSRIASVIDRLRGTVNEFHTLAERTAIAANNLCGAPPPEPPDDRLGKTPSPTSQCDELDQLVNQLQSAAASLDRQISRF